MADFLAASAIGGGSSALTLTIMGSSAAANTTLDALDRGVSDGKAMTLGIVAGVAEAITEKYSLDALFKSSNKGIKYILQNAFTEGTEEVSSSIINSVADVIISKDKSEWELAIKKYKENGKS